MSTRPHMSMACRLVEDTGVKHLPMRRSVRRRQALGVLLSGLFLLGLGTPQPVQAREKVPTEAANAGFTTLAQSWDFSSRSTRCSPTGTIATGACPMCYSTRATRACR
jgi:hypothetical protein